MAMNEPTSPLTSLPNVDDLPTTLDGGYQAGAVRDAFDAFRRHALQLQAQLRVLQAAGRSGTAEAPGHTVRMDALHVVRAAAELADTIERDAQKASSTQLQRTEAEIARRQREVQESEHRVDRYREESERLRDQLLQNAKNEARELLQNAHRDATAEIREAEARGARLLEQARHQATELTNAVRAEVDQTLEWARAQSAAILSRAQEGAEQLLSAAGLGGDRIAEVVDAIVAAAQATTSESRGPAPSLVETPPEINVPEPEAHREDEGGEESPSEPEQHGEDTTHDG